MKSIHELIIYEGGEYKTLKDVRVDSFLIYPINSTLLHQQNGGIGSALIIIRHEVTICFAT